jgi:hypothetical protein
VRPWDQSIEWIEPDFIRLTCTHIPTTDPLTRLLSTRLTEHQQNIQPTNIPRSTPYAALLGSSETPLLLAAENGHLVLIDFLIEDCGVNVDREQDADGARALHYACYGRSTAAVTHLLLRHRADPRVYSRDTGEQPLMIAAAHGPLATVRVLLADGRSDVEAPRRGRRGGQTAILLAAKGKHWASVEALLDHGADPTLVWPGRASFLKRTLLEFARTDPTCPPALLARIESIVADGERAELLHRLRYLSDAATVAAGADAAAAAAAGPAGGGGHDATATGAAANTAPAPAPPQRETRGHAARHAVKRVPACLAGRIRQRRPMPGVELVNGGEEQGGGESNSKRRRTVAAAGAAKDDGGGDDDEEEETEQEAGRRRAVAAHVVLGGMVSEHVKELLEMMAPAYVHHREARRVRTERGGRRG